MSAIYTLSAICLVASLAAMVNANPNDSGDGKTTRYWDCCKPSCSWKDNINNMLKGPVQSCKHDGQVADINAQSGCNGGDSFICDKQQPWAKNEHTAFGFVAGKVPGKDLKDICCSCYKLTFPQEPKLKGKEMIVQITNTGEDLTPGHFDIQMPASGVGIFNGCTKQHNAPEGGWGDRYGGIHSEQECHHLPEALKPGCEFRFKWFANADNPAMHYQRVKCPREIIEKSGCQRGDDILVH